jgi:N-acetylneuraminic acid mutarotase
MKLANSTFALCALLALFAAPLQAQAQAPQGVWSLAAEMTTERTDVAAVEAGGKIYLIAGQAQGRQDSPMAQEFDPATGRWRDLAPMPKGASHVGIAALNGKIYVAGGFTANVHMNPLDQFLEYDIAANSWRQLPPMPSRLGAAGLAVLGGKLHLVGGRGPDAKTVTTHSVFDLATGRWTMAAPLPVARDHLGIAAVDGKLYVIGGRTGATIDNTAFTDVYDPSTDRWQTMAPMPTKRSAVAAIVYRGRIVVFGGECKAPATGTTFDENEAYDPKTDRWTSLAKPETGRHAAGAAVLGDTAYFFGGNSGCGGGGPQKTVYAFKLP